MMPHFPSIFLNQLCSASKISKSLFKFVVVPKEYSINNYKFHVETKTEIMRNTCWANSLVGDSTRQRGTTFFDIFLSSFCRICTSAGTPNAKVLPIKNTHISMSSIEAKVSICMCRQRKNRDVTRAMIWMAMSSANCIYTKMSWMRAK